ncbi:polysaccharide pyruvyl transferase family protein [Actinokineospora diospyrosa]|uniref:Polysaccharide pyruvyl transferase family protein WcaK n=1 Tax=Actinokineospora diospyrosa TaxID=103728 RepID=A0ABT1IB38_9PSEU|nr:polysaccharide pyruvyl transferase family protein [Actinokineospora diospyrosa]MCP2269850.1 Polysaccharide pyruvyl transferase family protein WcaK [Actinokineospora diospyrosa]
MTVDLDGARRVLVVGNFGNGNTGDEALLARALTELAPGAQVSVLSRNPRLVEWTHGVAARPMTAVSFAAGLRWCDAVLVVGGGMFGSGLPPLVRLLPTVVEATNKAGRATFYLAVGVYPGTPPAVLRKLRSAAVFGRLTVRDNLSARTLGVPVPVVGDLALKLAPASTEAANLALAGAGVEAKAPLLLLSLKALPDTGRMAVLRETCLLAASRWRERGGEVAALALSTHADYGLGLAHRDAALAAALDLPVIGPQLPPALAKAVVGRAAGVLGLRLHALVFAAGMGVPFAGFDWEEKSRAFLAEYGGTVLGSAADWIDTITEVAAP